MNWRKKWCIKIYRSWEREFGTYNSYGTNEWYFWVIIFTISGLSITLLP